MKDAVGAGDQVEVSRQDVYEDYVNNYLHLCTEARPCRDDRLLSRATQVVVRDPEPAQTYTLFPFYQVVMENSAALRRDCKKHLSTVIKATELLETLCINLYLQPWRKEIRTVKTFTGPFVYCLMPVFSTSTIQSVLASIGYLPQTNVSPPSEYRLSEDANPDRALQMGFELLLARVQCLYLLKLLDQDQLRPQEWIEALQMKSKEHTENKTTEPMEEEQKKKEEEEKEEEEDTQRKQVSMSLDPKPAVNPKPKPRRSHLYNVDQSLMEMHRNYPDLSIRGRPVLQDKAPRGSSRSSSKAAHAASTLIHSDHSLAAQLVDKDPGESSRAAAAAALATGQSELFKATEVVGHGHRSNDGISTTGSNNNSSGGGRLDHELSGPLAMSLHITLRTGAGSEQKPKPGEDQSMAEPLVMTQQHSAEEQQNKRPTRADLSSVSSVDEAQELRELAQRMGQLHVSDGADEPKKMLEEDDPTERKNCLRPRMKTASEWSRGGRRSSRSSQSEQRLMEQRQPECQNCTKDEERQETEAATEAHPPTAEAWRGDDEHALSFVIL
ncbi:uncharacterized protein LOC115433735 [Sphaeramia orbicularis]|uniref:Uncharacterized LOC115433735 n=1 Tax=Sphaeramia orbicularis TaxID=375764 RepID=A0A673C2Y2_9TELE|nr:uncharacterized protein LOC115433735 [Sphaeramia orbicularis]